MRIIKTYLCHFTGHLKKDYETFNTKIFKIFVFKKTSEYYASHVLLSIISTPGLQS